MSREAGEEKEARELERELRILEIFKEEQEGLKQQLYGENLRLI